MKVNVYVNWNEQRVYNEEGFLEEMRIEVEDNFNDWANDWLNEHYTAYDLFYLTDEDKEKIETEMKEDLLQGTIDDRIGYEWEVATIEI